MKTDRLPIVDEIYLLHGHTPATVTHVQCHVDGRLRSVAYHTGNGISAPVLGSTWQLMLADFRTLAPPMREETP
jgi:hypothetical protein